jgi:glycosyltransferase involved in cell wall biosynthesis
MKILIVTNLYPPHHVGGYELGCRDVVEKLRARGHLIHVLTSTFRHDESESPLNEAEVERTLKPCAGPADPPHNKRAECAKLSATIRRFAPAVVYFWNQGGLCHWLPLAARWHGKAAAYFLSDTNFVSWRIGAWLLGPAQQHAFVRALFGKTFLVRGWPIMKNQTCHFASEFLRNVAEKNGIRSAEKNSAVAHWGIELAQFSAANRERWPVHRLLYVGQMIPQKGVHTAIAAFALLAKEKGFEDLTFTLAGGGMHPDYEKKLRELPAQLGVAGRVRFLGKVPRTDLPRVYAEHDVLIFPSEWDEPFAITPLEAMASGLAVVGTTTGGSGELFRNRETAMTFAAGDPDDCARAIRELCADRELFERISRRAQREVREKHTLDAMVDKIEQSLQKLKR